MELEDDDDLGTMIAIYCPLGIENPSPVELFAEITEPDPIQMVIPASQRSGIDFDLNVPWEDQSGFVLSAPTPENPNTGGCSYNTLYSSHCLEIHPEVLATIEHCDEGSDNDDQSHRDPNDDFSDLDLNDIPEDIDEEGPVEDPDAALAREFSEYPDIVPTHLVHNESDEEELFIGQQFDNKKDCLHAINKLSLKLGVDYKVTKSTQSLYAGECWKAAGGCKWRVRATLMQRTQMWMIRKLEGPHTCTSARMSQDHRKLDAKTICNCIIPLVKESPTIQVSVLIADMQARFKYKVSYRKAWWAKQMAMQELYGDWDVSYNGLQGWIAGMHEYVPGTVTDLQTLPYKSPDGEIQPGKQVFHRLFWTFESCVRAFPYCKPMRECFESWEFFLINLRRHVVREDNICLISDRSKGLLAAIRRSGVPWRSVYYIQHIAANFHRDYKNKDWKNEFVNMAYELEPRRFRQRFARLESQMSSLPTNLRTWLGSMENWQWTQSYDEGFQYGQMTTNLVEAATLY
ncbi:uncharacterized protein [Gossypium hirsutum]|uniref:Transposase MuDR plant domain-containing protein n=1 Tax=Gossypium hirsutum TaxID=3635 RepID=A0A1U8KC18_GOSHI|nr:uncharacterized protein LOC107915376 [Gossypium hirsutum]